jgi:hypothetical protein
LLEAPHPPASHPVRKERRRFIGPILLDLRQNLTDDAFGYLACHQPVEARRVLVAQLLQDLLCHVARLLFGLVQIGQLFKNIVNGILFSILFSIIV